MNKWKWRLWNYKTLISPAIGNNYLYIRVTLISGPHLQTISNTFSLKVSLPPPHSHEATQGFPLSYLDYYLTSAPLCSHLSRKNTNKQTKTYGIIFFGQHWKKYFTLIFRTHLLPIKPKLLWQLTKLSWLARTCSSRSCPIICPLYQETSVPLLLLFCTKNTHPLCLLVHLWDFNDSSYGTMLGSRKRQWHPTPVLLSGKSHGWRSLVGCSQWGHWELDMTEQLHFSLSCIGEGNGNPLHCSCLENPRDGGAWWAAICGVVQSWTWLKRLSSSSMLGSRLWTSYSLRFAWADIWQAQVSAIPYRKCNNRVINKV